ncbi:arylsulfatase [Sinomicrobium soli]|uniref:arylsulfatase n=1 Tax=Sinomicrobium sp. N-1-3-6 TaxID=2219864 RepID=UPI000DCDBB18|nr:arylsulfatase [Sinomicrobium sp. N-1-3-6]RAV27533.1 arylsulfatase [Sinomicrobium sp. N-1-3-6]
MKNLISGSVLALGIALSVCGCKQKENRSGEGETATPDKPNIILIMSDDMGYSDIGTYGGEVNTPNLDLLAENGLRFTQFYNTARCCPTRASLMTGLYPHQTGIGHMTNPPKSDQHDMGLPAYRGFLNKNNITLAELLKQAGYKTYMAGKWHLGMEKEDQWPLQRGFDRFYGILPGAANYFEPRAPRGITADNEQVEITDKNYYITDAFTDHALQFIDESREGDESSPFFLYLAYTAPHWPLQAPKEDIDKYRDRYGAGWKAVREERFERMKEMGIISEGDMLSEQDSPEWESLSDEKRAEMTLRRAIYSAQIDRMDQNIGRLVDHLRNSGLLENTLLVFLNDNGACAEGGMLGGGKAENLETTTGYFLSYGQAWANASNTPFRKYKHWLHEGGIATPLIVHWPAHTGKEERGKIIREYGFLPDIMATFAEVSGAAYPRNYKNHDIPPMEGKSLVPLIEGNPGQVHQQPIFWEHEGNKAVRLGDYKLVMEWKGKDKNHWELYNLAEDRSEEHDISEEEPGRVNEMAAMWTKWAEEKQVEPWDRILDIMNRKK